MDMSADLGIRVRLQTYHDLLLKWQKSVNLIAPSTVSDAWNRHFEDSLQIVDLLPEDVKTLADLGSGAGFPGLVIGIVRPEISVHLVESDQKKATFLKTVSRETNAKNIMVHDARVENVVGALRPDVITARALASLPKLLAMTRDAWDRPNPPLCIFPKGADANQEIDQARETYEFSLETCPSKITQDSVILCISQVSAQA